MSETVDESFPFSEEFQYCLLRLAIIDDTFMIKCANGLKEEYFNNKYLSWVFRVAVQYWNEYHKSPSLAIIENEIRKLEVSQHDAYRDILNKVMNAHGMDPNYIRRELTGFARRNIFVRSFKQVANVYNSKRSEDAYQLMKDQIEKLIAVDFENDKIVNFEGLTKYIDLAKLGHRFAIPTGILPIDNVMGGGLAPSTLTTLIAGTNVGKSMTLINIMYHAVRAGKKVVYIAHEDEETPTVLRVISRFTGIPYNKLLLSSEMLSPTEQQMVQVIQTKLKDQLIMKFMYGTETTIEEVRDWLMLRKKEFPFDLFIDDYGQIIRTRRTMENERFTQSIVYRSLKQIALEMDVAVVTVAQGNREAQKTNRRGTEYLRSTDLAECFEIARISSNIITLNRSEKQSQDNELIYFLEKQRVGKVGIAVRCTTDYSRCITHDEKLGMWEANSLNPLLEDANIVSDKDIRN